MPRAVRDNTLAPEEQKVHCDVTTVNDFDGVWNGMKMSSTAQGTSEDQV